MASDTDSADVTELTERNEDSGLSGVDKRKEIDVLLIQIKSRKRTAKTKVKKLRNELERVCVKDSEVVVIENVIEQLWTALENAQEILEELSAVYVEIGDESGKNETFDETETIEKEVQIAIERGQNAIKARASKTVNINKSWENTTDSDEQPTRRYQENENHSNHDDRNRFLKPLRIPTFDGDKRKFEDFWVLFRSLVDESTEPSNLKMARLRQCLTGNALEAIRGLGVTAPEYEEEILKPKYGGARRLLRAYMDQLEQMPLIRSNDIHALERFADLVRITVVKVQAERRNGELTGGTLHILLVKKLPDRQRENYSRWLNEPARETSVVAFRDWLKDEVRFRVEAKEMANRIESKPVEYVRQPRKVKINAILDDASNETFLNEEVAGVLGLQEPFHKVQVHVLNDTVETFQSMPLKIEIESLDGRFSKEISFKMCAQKVTGNYRVVNCSTYQNKWPHLTQCSFAKPANDGVVDLLIEIDNSELHYSNVDLRGRNGGPIARLGPLGWSCIGAPEENDSVRARSHAIRTLFTREPLWNEKKGSCCDVDNSLKRFWEIEKSGTDREDRLVYSPKKRDWL